MKKNLLPAVLAMVSAACSDAAGPGSGLLRIQPEREQYQPGEEVVLRLISQQDVAIYYNDCHGELQFLQTGSWAGLVPASPVPCRDNLLLLPARGERTVRFSLPADLQPGTYRFQLQEVQVVSTGEPVADPERSSSQFIVP